MTGNPTSRDHNKAAVLDVVLSRAPLTRTEVMEQTGLSKATVSRAVEELRADGFVVDGGLDDATGRGRRSTYLDVPDTAGHVVGVSFGAQDTCVLAADLRGRDIGRVLRPTVEHHDAAAAARWLVDMVGDVTKGAKGPLREVVVAVPGRVRSGAEILGPAEAMKALVGPDLQRTLAARLGARVEFDSDANASLLGILTEGRAIGNAALFSLSSILNFASCADHVLDRGRTPTFGDLGVLWSGVPGESLEGLMSTGGLLRFARLRDPDVQRVEDLWLDAGSQASRPEVLDALTTALVTAVSAVAVTLEPDRVYFVGRLQPLVEEVLPMVRRRLGERLPKAPEVSTPTQVLGLSVARGAVYACLATVREELRESVLSTRHRSADPAGSAPAY
ncbi:ROK family transcriptional regulator [Phycicoccus sp. M110.8]|uniref:ROK family transcriptional regulator n=1 Tax=Phycicoccus sp. M110.8 TaxID=3075433 RepID=UPI0028FD895C|nr:ROK family transcriptional regulator [Phycicoccus sp. M110.8]MDU0313113.1 ROK family transcriptional regulator [Phycicoccus sp. M110.8]